MLLKMGGMKRLAAARSVLLIFPQLLPPEARAGEPAKRVDVGVYGATPAGIVAAVSAKQEGCTVLVVEPSRWVGSILGAGITPMRDCAEPKAVGGLTATRVFKLGNRPDAIRQAFATWLEEEHIPSTAEHAEFQEYKKQYSDWQKRVRAELAK